MPLIKPFVDPNENIINLNGNEEDDENIELLVPDEKEINKALARAGILNKNSSDAEDVDNIRYILANNGASVEQAAKSISALASGARNEGTRLRASEVLLDLHGIRDKEGRSVKQPIFNFIIHSDQVNIQNVFDPQVHRQKNQG